LTGVTLVSFGTEFLDGAKSGLPLTIMTVGVMVFSEEMAQ